MKILKTRNPNAKKLNVKEKATELYKKIGKKNLIVIVSVLVIGLAVYLNWYLFAGMESGTPTGGVGTGGDISANLQGGADTDAGNIGEDNYFAASLISRKRARDEAIEVLETVVSSGASEDAAAQALSDISRIAADIENEANIESLVKSKGFDDCVAVISGDEINIIVKSSGLLPNEIAQIKEIVYVSANILPENVKIIEKA